MLKIYISLICLLVVVQPVKANEVIIPEINFSSDDRVLVLAPHPDDEVLGAGGILQHVVSKGLPVKVVFLTYGDSNPWSFLLYRKHPVVMPGAVKQMGLIRREEAENASHILGVGEENLIFLGYPDFGTLNIWYAHWGDRPALRAMMTRAKSVPYHGAYRAGAPYKGEEIVADLKQIMADFKPTKIFVSHPADHNGDHLALYLFTRIALWETTIKQPMLYPYLIHHIGWPKPKGFVPKQLMHPPQALAKSIGWSQYHLSAAEFDLKKSALLAHQTQYKSSPKYLLSFVRPNELFGDFNDKYLHKDADASVFQTRRKVVTTSELPDEYNDLEKSSFVGIDWKFVRWEGNHLVISIELSKPLAQDVEASVYIFGYNPHQSFAHMPKINVRLGVLSYNVYDQNKRIEQSSVSVKRTSNDITITVPIKLLGNPDRVLTSARTYLGNVPLDSASWTAVHFE